MCFILRDRSVDDFCFTTQCTLFPFLAQRLHQIQACKSYMKRSFFHEDGSHEPVRQDVVSSTVHAVVLLLRVHTLLIDLTTIGNWSIGWCCC